LVKGNWVICKTKNIVHIWPQSSPLCNEDEWKEYCQVKVILHVKYRSLQQLRESDSVSWSSIYYQYLDVINNNLVDLLGPSIDNEKEILDEKSQDEVFEDNEEEEFRYC